MSTIKISELATGTVSSESLLAFADVNGLASKGTIKQVIGNYVVNSLLDFDSLILNASTGVWMVISDITLDANKTIPTGVTLQFRNAKINLGGFTLTGTNTKIDAGLTQIFDTNGNLDGDWDLMTVYIQWFGASSDESSSQNTISIQKSLNLNKKVSITKGNFKFNSTLSVPKYTSIVGQVGANLIADFSDVSSWISDFTALRFESLGGADVTVNDFNTVFKNIVLTSINAISIEAIGVEIPNGATSSSILEARTFCQWDNLMVIGFDIAYRLGQLRESVLTGLKSRDCRVGIHIQGKTVNVSINSVNLFEGTVQTSSIETTKGVIIDSFFRGAVEERPEGIVISGGGLIAAFDVNVQYIRGLSVSVVDNIIDLSRGIASVQIGGCRGFTLTNNWIASQVSNPVILLDAASTPNDEVQLVISNNTINGGTNGIRFLSGRRRVLIEGNEFASNSSDNIFLDNSSDVQVLNNSSTSSSADMIYAVSCGDLIIDGNSTLSDYVLSLHPTSQGANNICIGKNKGVLQKTWEIGKLLIPEGSNSVVLNVSLPVSKYVIPKINILSLESSSSFSTRVAMTYNSPISSIDIVTSGVAPVGGIGVHYEIKSVWYGDR